MAWTTTIRGRNAVGNRREEYGKFTTDATSGTIQTSMKHVDEFDVISPADTGTVRHLTFYLNTDDTTEDNSVPGSVYMADITSGAVYIYRAVGW